jgi:hypothetical protein
MVALVVGAMLAFGVGLLATRSGLDRDRAFYPVTTIVIASYYALFAVMGGRLVAAALATHGIFDLVHGSVNDITFAAYLAWLLSSGRLRAAA